MVISTVIMNTVLRTSTAQRKDGDNRQSENGLRLAPAIGDGTMTTMMSPFTSAYAGEIHYTDVQSVVSTSSSLIYNWTTKVRLKRVASDRKDIPRIDRFRTPSLHRIHYCST